MPGSPLTLDPAFLRHRAEHWMLNIHLDCHWCRSKWWGA
jgi:hypothetical protein